MDAFICAVPPELLQEVLPSYRRAWRKLGKPGAPGPEKMMDGRWWLIQLIILSPEWGPYPSAPRQRSEVSLCFRPAADANMLRPSPLRAKHQGDPVSWPARLHYVGFGLEVMWCLLRVGCCCGVNKRLSRSHQCQTQIVFFQFQLFPTKRFKVSTFWFIISSSRAGNLFHY